MQKGGFVPVNEVIQYFSETENISEHTVKCNISKNFRHDIQKVSTKKRYYDRILVLKRGEETTIDNMRHKFCIYQNEFVVPDVCERFCSKYRLCKENLDYLIKNK